MTDSRVRVGVLTCGRVNHMPWVWGPLIDPCGERRRFGCDTRLTRMAMTHAWDIDREAAEDFARAYRGVEVVDHYTDMVGKVDGVILSDHDSCLHYAALVRPYLEAGAPVFVNRPFALSLADAHELLDLSRRTGTPIMTGSSFEFAPEVETIRREVAGLGPIRGYAASNSGSDYSTHGIHGVLFAHACIGGGVRSVAYRTDDWRQPNGIVTIEYEGRGGERPFYGSIQQITHPFAWIRVFGDRTFEQFVDSGLQFWVPILLQAQRMFETRQMPQSHGEILEKTQMFLAGFKSAVEHRGAPVALAEIGDWRAPLLNPDPYPAGFFAGD